MGFLTLDNFRDLVSPILGNRPSLDAAKLTQFINLGYFDVAGAVDFPMLDGAATIPTVAGTREYDVPAGVLTTILLHDTETDRLIRKVNITEVMRQDLDEAGAPTIWARHGDTIYVHPTPDDIRDIRLLHRSEPTPLAADGDLTVLPRTWDQAILLLAASWGFFTLNEDARSIAHYNRAVAYMKTRLVEGTITMPQAPTGGG